MTDDYQLCEWIGPMRQVPRFGTIEEGGQVDFPIELAKDFKRQGLVKFIKQTKIKEAKE